MSEDLMEYMERRPPARSISPVRTARLAALASLYRRMAPQAGYAAAQLAARIDSLPVLSPADAVVLLGALADKLQDSAVTDLETRDACDAMDAAALALGGSV